jgi:hypothetical protein
MSTLAQTHNFAYHRVPTRQPGLFVRLVNRFLQWRQHRAEQDIAIRLGLTGGHITDEIERRMSERLIGSGGFRG